MLKNRGTHGVREAICIWGVIINHILELEIRYSQELGF